MAGEIAWGTRKNRLRQSVVCFSPMFGAVGVHTVHL